MNDKDYVLSKWTNGAWTIEWIDYDYILITGPHRQKAKLCGGDFEGVLSALCASFNIGCNNEYMEKLNK